MLTWLKSSLPTLRNLSQSNRDRLRPLLRCLPIAKASPASHPAAEAHFLG